MIARPRRLGAWIAAGAFVGVVAGALWRSAVRSDRVTARAVLGVATGHVYGLTAVLTKSTVDLFDNGVRRRCSATGSSTPCSRRRPSDSC